MFLAVQDASASSITFYIDYPQDGVFPPPWTIQERFDAGGRVTAVRLTTRPGLTRR